MFHAVFLLWPRGRRSRYSIASVPPPLPNFMQSQQTGGLLSLCDFVRCSSRHNTKTAFVFPFHQRRNAFLIFLREIVYTHMVSNSQSQAVVAFQFGHAHFNTFYIHSSLRKIHGFPLLFAFASIHCPETPKSWKYLFSFPDIPLSLSGWFPILICNACQFTEIIHYFRRKRQIFAKFLILHFCF